MTAIMIMMTTCSGAPGIPQHRKIHSAQEYIARQIEEMEAQSRIAREQVTLLKGVLSL